ncbi:MAG: type IV toxin-antitoxin system AbiEi family antitoxin domain-containing protein [Chloroflexota bacterium]
MVVKKTSRPMDKLREILRDQNGVLFTSDLSRHGIPRTYLSMLEKNGEVQRISRGVYTTVNSMLDEMASLQAKYKVAIFSHETALYLHELTDRTPLFYSVTVPAGYNATTLKMSGVKVFFVQRDLCPLGRITMKSPHGNNIKVFDLERTICDSLRSRNQVDIQIVNDALKRYIVHPARNIDLLYRYATQFRIQNITREYLEVLL